LLHNILILQKTIILAYRMPSPNKVPYFSLIIRSLIHFFGKVPVHHNRKTRLITFLAGVLTVCAFGAAAVAPLAPDASDLPIKQITEELQLPSLEAQIEALEARNDKYIYEEKVQRGDTLARLLQRLNVDDASATNFIKSDSTARLVMQQKPGRTVRAQINEAGELLWLQTNVAQAGSIQNHSGSIASSCRKALSSSRHSEKKDVNKSCEHTGNVVQLKNITITRQSGTDAFNVVESPIALERRVEMKTGEIIGSLFGATDAAQIPDAVASQLVDMFSTDIDFSSDLRRGDHFQLLYETFWQNGEMVSTGRVLAGEFNNAGRSYQTVWFGESKAGGNGSYYGFDGKSIKKAFLKSPIAFTRISSGFSMRVHPLSGQWKQHTGVDFAASAGTPIHASADGVIDSIGKSGGYGNLLVLKHWNGYSTAYAHMSRFASGLRKGTKVRQGDVIGYVGATGWATGPHLHYEFRVNNKAQDPLKIKIEQLKTLAGADLPRFKSMVQDVQHRFALLRPGSITSRIAAR
jgi:murein DD-endopeptidase MepM/ murein hydrolase activator NlpD